MQFTSEQERREIISKLSKVKDPWERDRIMWALAGMEESFSSSEDQNMPPSRPATGSRKPGRPMMAHESQLKKFPTGNVNPRRMLGFVIPAFFIIFGLVQIGRAILNFMASQEIETEIPRLITGGIFLIIGLAGALRTGTPQRMNPDESS
jgi:hypothetical protein